MANAVAWGIQSNYDKSVAFVN